MIRRAALAMALGLWLFLLAVTPGRRRLLPVRQPTGVPGHRRSAPGSTAARPP
ncbi:hypothetical protein [Streptomyces agglomeratus]|uniref:hypothetical protein n=1 Tax=Streptomyces agglomeratus TaxID=285458 RepID=UPI003F740941